MGCDSGLRVMLQRRLNFFEGNNYSHRPRWKITNGVEGCVAEQGQCSKGVKAKRREILDARMLDLSQTCFQQSSYATGTLAAARICRSLEDR